MVADFAQFSNKLQRHGSQHSKVQINFNIWKATKKMKKKFIK
jgi:hypothetical protein